MIFWAAFANWCLQWHWASLAIPSVDWEKFSIFFQLFFFFFFKEKFPQNKREIFAKQFSPTNSIRLESIEYTWWASTLHSRDIGIRLKAVTVLILHGSSWNGFDSSHEQPHSKQLVNWKPQKFQSMYRNWSTHVIVGSGEPPMLLQVNSCFLSSVEMAMLPGATWGGCGGVNTVML